MLRNGNFEADWSEESSHWVKVFPKDQEPYITEVGNIFTPPGWLVWFRHEEGVWSQPECRDARDKDPDRMHSGEKGYLVFTFGRKHHAGLMQQVQVEPGARLRFSAWAHAWSNHKDDRWPDKFPHPDDPHWSEGAEVGRNPFFSLLDDSLSEEARNFIFRIGIDPTGGTNPFKGSVVWGEKAHIYNAFHQVPAVEAVAQSSTVTVFLLSKTWWPFKHNDAYWDDAVLEVVDEPEPEPEPGTCRGHPRVQYERTFVLFHPDMTADRVCAIYRQLEKNGYTFGKSADDAGIGDLDVRRVIGYDFSLIEIASLTAFFGEYYPGVKPVFRDSPDLMPPPTPEPDTTLELGMHDDGGGDWMVRQ